MQEWWIWILVGLLLWQGMVLLQFFIFLYYEFRLPEFHLCEKEKIDEQVQKMITPYEKHLFEKGFVFKYAVEHESMIVGSDLIIHRLYYYNEAEGIHATLETTPYKGSLQSIKLSYETIYESGNICVTENGVKHYVPVVPKEVYFFDHYLDAWKNVYVQHLKDRVIDGEVITRQAFDDEGWLAYMDYMENLFRAVNIENGLAKMTPKGYRYRASLGLWKLSKEMQKGYRRFSKILRDGENNQEDKEGKTQGLLTQMDQVDKTRGDNSSKKRWFAISVIAFVVLFSFLGLSVVDIVTLVIVLFLHELGHFLAMRYFGYRDTSIFFLPFGAVTTGQKAKRNAYEEFIVSLMGPLPGIIISIFLLLFVTQYNVEILNNSFISTYAMMSLVINYINLLPIYPLDGGRILQTLLLLRYPKGQFYFYVIGLGILIFAIVWMKDPLLLIFVVLVALGLKQSYKMSELLQKLFKKHRKDEIMKEDIALLLTEDEKFSKESLASKARIAKQAQLIIDTTKPSKALMIFGLGLYIILLSPVLFVGALTFSEMHNSSYTNLTKKGKIELRHFNKKVLEYQKLTEIDDVNYTIEDSMIIIDKYLTSSTIHRKIGKVLIPPIEKSKLPCSLSDSHLKILQWHNGIDQLLPHQNLFSYQEIIDKYVSIKKENESYGEKSNSDLILSLGDEESYGLAYSCTKNGLFDYSPYAYDSSNIKKYYNWNHFLKITAEAYKDGIYREENNRLDIDEKRLAKLERKYYSSADKEKYREFVKYLENRAEIYKNEKDTFLKITLLQTIGRTYDSSLLDSVKIYLKDTDKKVKEQALYVLGKVGTKSTLPMLITYTKSKDNTERNFALLSMAEIVDNHDNKILESLYPLLDDKDILVRLGLYDVINKIKDIHSLPYLRQYFSQETARGKLEIIDIFSDFGTKNELKLLNQYLSEVSKMDMSKKDLGGFRGSDPHPKVLKKHLEDAIKNIEKRETI